MSQRYIWTASGMRTVPENSGRIRFVLASEFEELRRVLEDIVVSGEVSARRDANPDNDFAEIRKSDLRAGRLALERSK